MIVRIWHGWTTLENADTYERLLHEEIFPGIAAMQVEGFRGIELLRREAVDDEVEFVTILRFESMAAIEAFAGEDPEKAHVPASARKVLSRFDQRAQHYELRYQLKY